MSRIILSRVPFRISLGGGSTDLPSYYEKHGGFIFAATVNLYMDVLIKSTISDDLIHVTHKQWETAPTVTGVQHELTREALSMHGIGGGVSISFKADTPAGTGLGSSGACAVALLKGLAVYVGKEMNNEDAAAASFELTQNLELPDGKQDPYACALGKFVVLEIARDGTVTSFQPDIQTEVSDRFFANTLFLYTGVQRHSAPILANQDHAKIFDLKHKTKDIGRKIYQSFLGGNLDDFGRLMHEHWTIKKQMSTSISNPLFDQIYDTAYQAGALGGKIMGAGAGGYFMFYCPNIGAKDSVRQALAPYNLREMPFKLDTRGARTQIIEP